MGSGKSAVGRRLAQRLGRPFIDLDRRVERRTGRTVAQLFEEEGEEGFRARERAELAQVLAEEPAVIATGGGVVVSDPNRVTLRDAAFVVWLKVRPETAMARVGGDQGRPLLGDRPLEALQRLDQERERLYRGVSHAVVETDDRSPDDVVDVIIRKSLGDDRAQP